MQNIYKFSQMVSSSSVTRSIWQFNYSWILFYDFQSQAHPFVYRWVFSVDSFSLFYSVDNQKKLFKVIFIAFGTFFFSIFYSVDLRWYLMLGAWRLSNVPTLDFLACLSDLCFSREMNTLILSRRFLFFFQTFFFSFWFGVLQ